MNSESVRMVLRLGAAARHVWRWVGPTGGSCLIAAVAWATPLLPVQQGLASVYSDNLDGKRTASGERYDRRGLTAAHRTLPLGAELRVTNLGNGKSVRVRVNDRGPHIE